MYLLPWELHREAVLIKEAGSYKGGRRSRYFARDPVFKHSGSHLHPLVQRKPDNTVPPSGWVPIFICCSCIFTCTVSKQSIVCRFSKLAGHIYEVAQFSPLWCPVLLFMSKLLLVGCTFCLAVNTFSCYKLRKIWLQYCVNRLLQPTFSAPTTYTVPVNTARTPGSLWMIIPGKKKAKAGL